MDNQSRFTRLRITTLLMRMHRATDSHPCPNLQSAGSRSGNPAAYGGIHRAVLKMSIEEQEHS